ncbi:ATP binding [Branchiostoma belcheri]|nr:ATP binding [Branchiostoma belcheri]
MDEVVVVKGDRRRRPSALVKVGYLMPGHAHEDVDQMFSRFSVHLSRHDAPTVPDLLNLLTAAYKPTTDFPMKNLLTVNFPAGLILVSGMVASVHYETLMAISPDGTCPVVVAFGDSCFDKHDVPYINWYGKAVREEETKLWTAELSISNSADTVYEKYRISLSAQMYQPIQNSTFLTMKERQVYLGKARASFDDPPAVLSIIIDGMVRNKTAIPNFAHKTKWALSGQAYYQPQPVFHHKSEAICKMETMGVIKHLVRPGKLDLKDAYFTIPVDADSLRFLTFQQGVGARCKTTRHTKLNNVRFIGENAIRLAKYSYRLVDALENPNEDQCLSMANLEEEMDHVWDYFATTVTQLVTQIHCPGATAASSKATVIESVERALQKMNLEQINMSIKIATIKIQRQPTKMVAIISEKLFTLTGYRRFHRDELKRIISTMTINFSAKKSSQLFFRKRDSKGIIGKAVITRPNGTLLAVAEGRGRQGTAARISKYTETRAYKQKQDSLHKSLEKKVNRYWRGTTAAQTRIEKEQEVHKKHQKVRTSTKAGKSRRARPSLDEAEAGGYKHTAIRGLCSTVQPETSTSWDVMMQVHPEAQLQTQNMNMVGDDPEDQAEAAWSQENAWLGRLEQIWSDPGVDHYSRVSAWSSWVRLLVEFNRSEEWLYSAAQGA